MLQYLTSSVEIRIKEKGYKLTFRPFVDLPLHFFELNSVVGKRQCRRLLRYIQEYT